MEAGAHAEDISEIPIDGSRPCCDKVAVAGDIHLCRCGRNNVKVDDKNVGVTGMYRSFYAGKEHDGGVVRKCVDGKSRLNDYQRQGLSVVCRIGGVLAQIAHRASAYADNTVHTVKVLCDKSCIFGCAVNDAVIGLSYNIPLDLIPGLEEFKYTLLDLTVGIITEVNRAGNEQDLLALGE